MSKCTSVLLKKIRIQYIGPRPLGDKPGDVGHDPENRPAGEEFSQVHPDVSPYLRYVISNVLFQIPKF